MSQRPSSFFAVRFIIAAVVCGLFFTLASFHTKAAEFSFVNLVGEFLGLQRGDAVHVVDGNPHPDRPTIPNVNNGKILFSNFGGYIYIVDPATGADTVLAPGSLPAWKPDGTAILFVDQNNPPDAYNYEIKLMDPDGTNPRSLGTRTYVSVAAGKPAWSPDGTKIVFGHKSCTGNCGNYQSSLYVADANGSNPIQYTDTVRAGFTVNGDSDPVWQPVVVGGQVHNGQIAFVRDFYINGRNYDEIHTIPGSAPCLDDASCHPTNLTNNPHNNSLPWSRDSYPAWSPDGTKIVFQSDHNAISSPFGDIYVMDPLNPPLGHILQRVTNDNYEDLHPTFSPDGMQIAWASGYRAGTGGDDYIFVMPSDGNPVAETNQRRVAINNSGYGPSWGPGSGSPPPLTAALSFDGRLRDRVSKSDAGITPDGESDGTFSLTLPPAAFTKTFQSIVVTGPNGNVWDTIPQPPPIPPDQVKWIVGISDTLDNPLFNQADGHINFAVGNAGTFKLFVPDSNPSSFQSGRSFTVTVNFTDGSTATATTVVNRSEADVAVIFSPRPPTSALAGDTITFSALVTNNGPEVAHGVVFDGFIDSGFNTPIITNGIGCSVSGNHVACNIGDLAFGSAVHIAYTAKAIQAGSAAIRIFESVDINRTFDPYNANAGDTANITIAPPTVELLGLEVTQAVQNLKNDTPLVAERGTFVRAYVRTTAASSGVNVSAFLTGTNSGGVTNGRLSPSNPGQTVKLLQSPQRGTLTDSFYFELPSDWIKAGTLQFRIESPDASLICEEPDGVPNCATTVTFQRRRPFSLRLFSTSGVNAAGTYLYPSGADEFQTLVEIASNFPITYGDNGVTLKFDTWAVNQEYCTLAGITAMRDSLLAKRARACLTGTCEDFYFGLVPEAIGAGICTSGAATGIAALNYNPPRVPPPPIGIKTDNSGNAAIGWAQQFNSRAHELGHNFGFPHTCNAKDANGNFIEGGCIGIASGDGTISLQKLDYDPDTYFGFDPYRETLTGVVNSGNYLNHGRIYGPYSPDMMSYGKAAWISGYSYKRIFDSLAPQASSPEDSPGLRPERVDVTTGKVFQINGSVSTSTSVGQIGSVYTIDFSGSMSLPPVGDWNMSIRNAQGTQLANYSFQPIGNSDGSDNASFSLIVPWAAEAQSIVLLHNGQTVYTRSATAHAPVVTVTFPNGGEILSGQTATFSWTASDPDGDPLTYSLEYSTDRGATWNTLAINWTQTSYPVDLTRLPGSSNALIRVTASDGFNSVHGQSNATFTVPQHAPQALIGAPTDGNLYVGNQTIVLRGMALDAEDGLLGGSNLSWTSNLNGPLGTGASLAIDASTLQEGTHMITLSANDSSAQVGTASISIRVFRNRPVLPVSLSVGPTDMAFNASAGTLQTAAQIVAIRNGGDGDLTWSATADRPWIRMDSTSGMAPSNLSITADPTGLAIGQYAGNITLTAPGAANSPLNIPLTFAVTTPIPVTVSGRVLTSDGRGLRNATASITDSNGVVRTTTTSSFGFYSFSNVLTGGTYTVRIASRFYRFAPRTVPVADNLLNIDFMGLE